LQGTILDFDLESEQEEIVPERAEIDLDFLKKLYKDQLEEDLEKKIKKANNSIKKWSQTREELNSSITVNNSKSTGKLKTKEEATKELEKKIKKKRSTDFRF